MFRHLQSFRVVAALSAIILAAVMGTARNANAATAAGPAATYRVGPITDVSTCGGQNAEVEQAVDPKLGYVYEEWMGCKGIAVARSANGGRPRGAPARLPRHSGAELNTRGPATAAAPDTTL